MTNVGTVASLWRYPVKSMRGEELSDLFVGRTGVRGDRLLAFRSSAAPKEFPYFTAREQRQMLLYRPRYRAVDTAVDVETPDGDTLAIDDPLLISRLRAGADAKHQLTLMHSEQALTDAQPVSVISLQTVRALADEIAAPTDERQFRANIYLDLPESAGFAENKFVGRSLRVGREVVLSVIERDPRCMMITLDPETAAKTPALLKQVAVAHGGTAGVYATVLAEGSIHAG
ncbi:MAG TPA: MOSC N-terminal beta barrel domain-containing protein, partial [Chthoniobacterales bacterium]|nr:MOSC N-terminal beta barrel domain-containing protein [Chthoniobacterales bacterium]